MIATSSADGELTQIIAAVGRPNPEEKIMTEIHLTDLKGDHWEFLVGNPAINKRDGRHYLPLYVMEGPAALTTSSYRYDIIMVPIFTEWF